MSTVDSAKLKGKGWGGKREHCKQLFVFSTYLWLQKRKTWFFSNLLCRTLWPILSVICNWKVKYSVLWLTVGELVGKLIWWGGRVGTILSVYSKKYLQFPTKKGEGWERKSTNTYHGFLRKCGGNGMFSKLYSGFGWSPEMSSSNTPILTSS